VTTQRPAGLAGAGLAGELAEIVGGDHVRTDAGALETFARDATPLHRATPDAICFPGETREVAAVIELAAERGIPVVPRGSGTNLCAATVPHRGGIVLSLTRMNRLLELDAANMVAVCQPGVITARLGEAAAERGLLYPPDPGSRATSTIAGNVATCAGGLRGLKYGVTRDYVLGCEVVIGTGETLRCGGKLVKDVAGLDLTRLLCGSEGTLGVITELTVRLVPAAAANATGVAYFSDLADAGRAVSQILAAGVLPVTLEFLDHTCLETVEEFAGIGLRTDAGALLIFGQDGAAEAIAGDMSAMAEACAQNNGFGVEIADSDADAQELLEARRAVLPSLSRRAPLTILEDASVPRARLAEMVQRIDAIAAEHDLLIGTFGHAGDGNLHPTCVVDPAQDGVLQRVEQAFAQIFAAALELGGTISGEHGIGLAKRDHLRSQLGDAHMRLLTRLKAAFDPADILNPGKLAS